MSLVMEAAQRLAAIAAGPLQPAVAAKAELCLLDVLACCAAAGGSPFAETLRRYGRGEAGSADPGAAGATAWSLGRVPAGTAAFCNAALSHSLIREDMHVGSGSHIGVSVIPAVLAVAERDGLPGRAVIAGIVAGYEAAGRLGAAIRGSGAFNRHLRPSGMNGAFGAAAGACAAAGLDAARTANALSLAANFACGLNEWAWSGGEEIFTHAGAAARNGLAAFDLARAGVASSGTALEGPDGLFAAMGCGPGAGPAFAASLDRLPCILDVRHKPVAGCNFIQTAVAAALQLREQIGPDDTIEAVVIHTFDEARRYPGCNHAGPFATAQQTKMSFQFGVCSALLWGEPDERSYARFDAPDLSALLPRCRFEMNDRFARAFPGHQSGGVVVLLADGRRVECLLDDVPWLDGPAVERRFQRDLTQAGSEAWARRTSEAVRGLAVSGRAIEPGPWLLPSLALVEGAVPC